VVSCEGHKGTNIIGFTGEISGNFAWCLHVHETSEKIEHSKDRGPVADTLRIVVGEVHKAIACDI